jgi:hypothetical protein
LEAQLCSERGSNTQFGDKLLTMIVSLSKILCKLSQEVLSIKCEGLSKNGAALGEEGLPRFLTGAEESPDVEIGQS